MAQKKVTQESSFIGDRHANVNRVLSKYEYDIPLSEIENWINADPTNPGDVKKEYIVYAGNVDLWDIDLKDPVTWGDIGNVPPDKFFIDMLKAIRADERRKSLAASYEF